MRERRRQKCLFLTAPAIRPWATFELRQLLRLTNVPNDANQKRSFLTGWTKKSHARSSSSRRKARASVGRAGLVASVITEVQRSPPWRDAIAKHGGRGRSAPALALPPCSVSRGRFPVFGAAGVKRLSGSWRISCWPYGGLVVARPGCSRAVQGRPRQDRPAQVSVSEFGELEVSICEIGAAPVNALHICSDEGRPPKIPLGQCCPAEIDVLEVRSLGATARQIGAGHFGLETFDSSRMPSVKLESEKSSHVRNW